MEFNLDEGNQGSLCVVSVCGDVDIYTAPLLDACLQRNVSAGNSDIALDLTGCSYFDSEGIKVLIRALHALGEQGKICICGARGAVRRVFEISGLTTIFALRASVDDLLRDSALLILVMLSQIIRLLSQCRLV